MNQLTPAAAFFLFLLTELAPAMLQQYDDAQQKPHGPLDWDDLNLLPCSKRTFSVPVWQSEQGLSRTSSKQLLPCFWCRSRPLPAAVR